MPTQPFEQEQSDGMIRIRQLKFCLSRLSALRFPSLPRPSEGPHVQPSHALVNWAVRAYVFSSICHYRELLRSFVLLMREGQHMAAFVVARSLFELAAHAYYVAKHTKQYLDASDRNQAWKFLTDVSIGSRHMREYGLKDLGIRDQADDYPESPHISKAIAALDEWKNLKLSREAYSFLSEFAHPSTMAFNSYREIDKKSWSYIFNKTSPIQKTSVPLGSVMIATIVLCECSMSFLARSGESEIARELHKLLTDFADRYGPNSD